MGYPISESVIQALGKFLKSNAYIPVRLMAGMLTLLVLLAYQYIPAKTITLFPDPQFPYYQFGSGGAAPLIGANDRKFSCDFKPTDSYSCGISLLLAKDGNKGLNLEDFDGLIVTAKYTGAANRYRIAMQNHNPAYSSSNLSTAKSQQTVIRSSDLKKPAFIKFSEFSVAEWWITHFDISREHSAPEFTNITAIVFDFIDYQQQELEIQKVELVGARFSREALYLGVLLFWMCLLIGEGIIRFVLFYRDSKRANQKIKEMAESYQRLEIEKKEFEALSATDKLTGITNRTGIDNFVRKVFEGNYQKTQLGIMLFDIDHFKKINDTYGHDEGDRVLQGLAKLISVNIREIDVFGRWGGEEFIIIAPQTKKENLINLAEKLRLCVASHVFVASSPLQVTISIGVAMVKSNESFESALKKADTALYAAKNQGRNCTVHSPDI
jgi:diguanylate cyclase (GGDEF)-like protein